MWRPSEPAEDDVSDLPVSIRRANAAIHAAALGATGLLTKSNIPHHRNGSPHGK
jgi:hypothetical protein